MPKVAVLSCPSCGGPLDEGRAKCAFCGARVHISADRTRAVLVGIACPTCAADNEPARRFCGDCGAALVEYCGNCREPNTVGVEFCGACGANLLEARRLAYQKAMDARTAAVQKAAEGAKRQQRWLKPAEKEYRALYKELKSPGETAIVVLGGRAWHTMWHECDFGSGVQVVLVATDESFLVLGPPRAQFAGGSTPSVAMRVPFCDVVSMELDHDTKDLVITLQRGHVRARCQNATPGPRAEWMAKAMVRWFKPFLPHRLQQGW